MKIWKKAVLFYLGGSIYVALELLWRGRSHSSMFLAGGLSFLLIGHQGDLRRPLPLPLRALLGSGIVTMVELGTGLIANRDYGVWDYRGQPGNLWGQICPLFSLIWIPVSLAAIVLYEKLDGAICRRSLDKPAPCRYDGRKRGNGHAENGGYKGISGYGL